MRDTLYMKWNNKTVITEIILLEQTKCFPSPVTTCTNAYDLCGYFTKKLLVKPRMGETLKKKLVYKNFSKILFPFSSGFKNDLNLLRRFQKDIKIHSLSERVVFTLVAELSWILHNLSSSSFLWDRCVWLECNTYWFVINQFLLLFLTNDLH